MAFWDAELNKKIRSDVHSLLDEILSEILSKIVRIAFRPKRKF
jgi:hypothetical protein